MTASRETEPIQADTTDTRRRAGPGAMYERPALRAGLRILFPSLILTLILTLSQKGECNSPLRRAPDHDPGPSPVEGPPIQSPGREPWDGCPIS